MLERSSVPENVDAKPFAGSSPDPLNTSFRPPLVERIQAARDAMSKEASERKWRTFSDLARLEPEHKLSVLDRYGLIDENAAAYLQGVIGRIGCAEDRVEISLVSRPVPESLADLHASIPELGLARHGSLLVRESYEQKDWPAWSSTEPAYTSRLWKLTIAVIGH